MAGAVDIDAAWKPLLEEICILKEALDHAIRWRDHGPNEKWINSSLKQFGLSVESLRLGSAKLGPRDPRAFGKMLLGTWFRHSENPEDLGMMHIPSWAVMGWIRKDQYRNTPQLSRAELRAKAASVNVSAAQEKPSTYGFHGIPLYWAGEGKNRTQLFRLAEIQRLANLQLYEPPSFKDFRVRPVAGLPWAVALETPDSVEILPFGNLSRKIYEVIGVQWLNSPSVTALRALRGCIPRYDFKRPSWFQVARWTVRGRSLQLALIGGPELAGSSEGFLG